MFIRPNGIVAFRINDQLRQQILAKNSKNGKDSK